VELLFVYNADSGLTSALRDWLVKLVAPERYACQLCRISYGNFGMNPRWRAFVKQLPYSVRFLHRDELVRMHPQARLDPPGLLLHRDGEYEVLLERRDVEALDTLDALMARVSAVLSERTPPPRNG
jgi:hypothetical protein